MAFPATNCYRCERKPEEIREYVTAAIAEGTTAAYEAEQDGTFNPENGHFCCTQCYIEIGMPTSPTGWKAP